MASYVPLQENIQFPTSQFDNTLCTPTNNKSSSVKVVNATTYRETIPNKNMGGSSQINMPVMNLLKNVILVLKLKAGTDPNDLKDGHFLPQSWGYDAIDYIEYNYGTNSPLRVVGEQMRVINLSQAESGEKKQQLLRLAGEEFNGGVASPTSSAGFYYAYINLALPHSNANSGRQIPYDMGILNNVASIKVVFNQASNFITRNEGDAAVAFPTRFEDAYIAFQQQLLADGQSDSVKSLVSRAGGRKYDYPFMYSQYYVTEPFTGSSPDDPTPGQPIVRQLFNFVPGSVQSIDLWLERVSYGVDADNANGAQNEISKSKHNKAWYVPLGNVELLYGGQAVLRYDDDLQEVLTLSDYPTGGTFNVQVPPYLKGSQTGASDTVGKVSQICHLQLSQYNEQFINGGLIQTGMQLNNSTVSVSFTTPSLRDIRIAADKAITEQCQYRLHCNYNYQCSLRASMGNLDMLFVKPERLIPDITSG